MKILLLEDDFAYRETMRDYLVSLGYSVDDFENGQEALDAVFEQRYDLLLLDIRVPGMDGYEIIKTIREYQMETPAIFVTSLTDIQNLSLGYELGCNDYIRKPFAMKELKYRVGQVLKSRFEDSIDLQVALDACFTFNCERYELRKNGVEISLTKTEQKLLYFFAQNLGRVLSSENLREYVWDGQEVNDSDIRMAIKKLRDKTDKALIKNIRGQGYKIEKKH
jgi:DNA-binding response OmpR family regulator